MMKTNSLSTMCERYIPEPRARNLNFIVAKSKEIAEVHTNFERRFHNSMIWKRSDMLLEPSQTHRKI